MAKRTSKKIIHEADVQGHDADQAPESAMQARVTAAEYIAREYGEAIRAGNVSRMLEAILVEIVKWRMDR